MWGRIDALGEAETVADLAARLKPVLVRLAYLIEQGGLSAEREADWAEACTDRMVRKVGAREAGEARPKKGGRRTRAAGGAGAGGAGAPASSHHDIPARGGAGAPASSRSDIPMEKGGGAGAPEGDAGEDSWGLPPSLRALLRK